MSATTLGLGALVPAAAAVLTLGARVLRSDPRTGDWSLARPGRADTPVDQRMWALQRLLGDHLEARHPSKALRLELRRLADRRLVLRHGIRIQAAPERAVDLLGHAVVALLTADDDRRMRLDEVDEVLRRIEQL